MLDEVRQGGELSLADAVHAGVHVDAEVLVPPRGLERNGVVSDLETKEVYIELKSSEMVRWYGIVHLFLNLINVLNVS